MIWKISVLIVQIWVLRANYFFFQFWVDILPWEPDPLICILYLGLDRSIATIAGWIKTILTTEQKKTDYNPQVLFFIFRFAWWVGSHLEIFE